MKLKKRVVMARLDEELWQLFHDACDAIGRKKDTQLKFLIIRWLTEFGKWPPQSLEKQINDRMESGYGHKGKSVSVVELDKFMGGLSIKKPGGQRGVKKQMTDRGSAATYRERAADEKPSRTERERRESSK